MPTIVTTDDQLLKPKMTDAEIMKVFRTIDQLLYEHDVWIHDQILHGYHPKYTPLELEFRLKNHDKPSQVTWWCFFLVSLTALLLSFTAFWTIAIHKTITESEMQQLRQTILQIRSESNAESTSVTVDDYVLHSDTESLQVSFDDDNSEANQNRK